MSTNQKSRRTTRPSKQHAKKGHKGSNSRQRAVTPFSADFQDRVARLDKLMQLAAAPSPKAPPGFTLVRKDGDGGTLEQVGREADNAWAGVKRIMSLLNVEEKHLYYRATANVTQAGAVLDMGSLITQGVGGAQRTGDSIKIKRFRVKWSIYAGSNSDDFTLVVGRSKDGIPATMTDIFDTISTNTCGLNFPSDTYEKADIWLASHTGHVNPATATGEGDARRGGEFDVRVNQDLMYTNGTAVTSSGSIWFASICNSASSFPVIAYAFDITFVDN